MQARKSNRKKSSNSSQESTERELKTLREAYSERIQNSARMQKKHQKQSKPQASFIDKARQMTQKLLLLFLVLLDLNRRKNLIEGLRVLRQISLAVGEDSEGLPASKM